MSSEAGSHLIELRPSMNRHAFPGRRGGEAVASVDPEAFINAVQNGIASTLQQSVTDDGTIVNAVNNVRDTVAEALTAQPGSLSPVTLAAPSGGPPKPAVAVPAAAADRYRRQPLLIGELPSACRRLSHWLLKNACDTSAFGTTRSKPWNAPNTTSTWHGTPAAFSRSA